MSKEWDIFEGSVVDPFTSPTGPSSRLDDLIFRHKANVEASKALHAENSELFKEITALIGKDVYFDPSTSEVLPKSEMAKGIGAIPSHWPTSGTAVTSGVWTSPVTTASTLPPTYTMSSTTMAKPSSLLKHIVSTGTASAARASLEQEYKRYLERAKVTGSTASMAVIDDPADPTL